MSCEREIFKRLLEGVEPDYAPDVEKDEDLEEAGFVANGKVFKAAFGHYSCDGEPISREDYFAAKEGGNVSGGSGGILAGKGKSAADYQSGVSDDYKENAAAIVKTAKEALGVNDGNLRIVSEDDLGRNAWEFNDDLMDNSETKRLGSRGGMSYNLHTLKSGEKILSCSQDGYMTYAVASGNIKAPTKATEEPKAPKASPYESYKPEDFDSSLDSFENEIEDLVNDMRDIHPMDRDDQLDRLDQMSDVLTDMEDYLTDEQYERADDLQTMIRRAKDTDYDGPSVPEYDDPYLSRGLRQSDFY